MTPRHLTEGGDYTGPRLRLGSRSFKVFAGFARLNQFYRKSTKVGLSTSTSLKNEISNQQVDYYKCILKGQAKMS